MNLSVNAGIRRAFTHGLLTSTSVLANAPSCAEALESWRKLLEERRAGRLPSHELRSDLGEPDVDFDLGVHLNLTQGRPLTESFPKSLLNRDGGFLGTFGLFARLLRSAGKHQSALFAELHAQVSRVCAAGIRPTHLNGHQYVEMFPGVRELIPELMRQHSIGVVRVAYEPKPVLGRFAWLPRLLALVKARYGASFGKLAVTKGLSHPNEFHGASHAGRIDRIVLQRFLANSRAGVTEIALHPGESSSSPAAAGWNDPLSTLRPAELKLLTTPDVAALIGQENFVLGRLSCIRSGDQ